MPVEKMERKIEGLPEVPLKEWLAEGERLFGTDRTKWRFVCPSCGHVQSVEDFIELKRLGILTVDVDSVVAFSCIGRFDTRIPDDKVGTIFDKEPKRQPCNYTNGGLFCLANLMVVDEKGKKHPVFEFARNVMEEPS